jgi:Ribbon-helix-helix protein, copG family
MERTMPFERKDSEPLDTRITVRLSESECERLKEDANLAGLTVSELLRRRSFGRPIVASLDRAVIKELMHVRAAINRAGGLVKHAHVESNGAYSTQTAGVLQQLNLTLGAVRDYMEALVRDREKG